MQTKKRVLKMSKSLSFRLRLSSVMDLMTKTAMEEICKIVDSDFAFLRQELSRVMSENAALKDKMLCVGSERRDKRTRITKEGARSAPTTHRSICVQTEEGEHPSIKGIFGKDWCSSLWDRRNEPRGDEMAIDVDLYSVSPYKHKETNLVIIKEENFEVDDYPSCTGTPPQASRAEPSSFAYEPSKNNFVSGEFSEVQNSSPSSSDQHPTEAVTDDAVDQLIAPIDDLLEYDGPCILSSQLSEDHDDQFFSEAQENEEEAEVYTATTAGHRVKRQRVQKLTKSFSCYDDENVLFLQNVGQRKHRFPKIKTNEKFRCEVCGRCFHSNTNLLVHYAVHTGEKPYKCSFCEKGFSQKGNLQAHERIHRGEKPFSCVICGRSFTQKVCLRNHERIHRGEKPFTCMTCGKGFTQKVTLQQHLAVHDKTTKRVRRKPRKNHCDLDFSFM